jgi:hypothetical protein
LDAGSQRAFLFFHPCLGGTFFFKRGQKMKISETTLHCQIPCIARISEGIEKVPTQSFNKKIKFSIRRRLSPKKERSLKNYSNNLIQWLYSLIGRKSKDSENQGKNNSAALQPGDWVRVRSLNEIEASLNHWRQLKGCAFMPEMAPYCGTKQKVLKPMKRFVDERDLRVKKSKGIILLEGVTCQGTADFGRCDRSCFIFWREEWLEKITESSK